MIGVINDSWNRRQRMHTVYIDHLLVLLHKFKDVSVLLDEVMDVHKVKCVGDVLEVEDDDAAKHDGLFSFTVDQFHLCLLCYRCWGNQN